MITKLVQVFCFSPTFLRNAKNSTLSVCFVVYIAYVCVTSFIVVDQRDRTSKHWSDHSMEDRIYYTENKGFAVIIIEDIRITDGGQYRCREDFKYSPTRNNFILLDIISNKKFLYSFNNLYFKSSHSETREDEFNYSYIFKQFIYLGTSEKLKCSYTKLKRIRRHAHIINNVHTLKFDDNYCTKLKRLN
ncbi:hemicentin-1-like [Aphis craccivora]|uniref:Hemicentin-1-like n=1 Tax=Aphis craccivora TaxID=307492 RepID=A0A6G0ZK43_APHCR|nr:hemicentin-1-like [Aphis craccivora]